MQTMNELIKQKTLNKAYNGIFDCAFRVAKEEGKKAFWKGNASNLIRFYPNESLNFIMKSMF
jgi:solute carrier family 25 (adenine nucleotide translocator) protein 4/5/6/31